MNACRDRCCDAAGAWRRHLIGFALLSLLAGRAMAQVSPTPTASALAFDGVTVIDVEHGKLVPGQRVIVLGNRITTVGAASAVRLPKGARIVDARDKYLIPGLWDLHTHPLRSTELFYPLFLANGVTGIRDAGSPVPLDTLRLWRREILDGKRVGPPRQILSGPSLNNLEVSGYCIRDRYRAKSSPMTCVRDETDARQVVDSLVAAGPPDMIKARALTPPVFFAIAAEARRLGFPFGGHAQTTDVISFSDSGARIVDHADNSGIPCFEESGNIQECQVLADRFRRNDTWLLIDRFRTGGELYRKRMREFWAGTLLRGNWLHDSTAPQAGSGSDHGSLSIAQRVGLPLVAGTDAPMGAGLLPAAQMTPASWNYELGPGFLLHDMLAGCVVAGLLTPLAALQIATLNPAKMWHATDSLGTVAPGKLADLVLLDANPLEDITNTTAIRAVVANGRYYDRAALDEVLATVQAKVKASREGP